MTQWVNVPRLADKGVEIVVKVELGGNDIEVWKVPKNVLESCYSARMASIFLGDHMLTAANLPALRQMIGRELASAVTQGRDIGYRQAQADIRAALGSDKP